MLENSSEIYIWVDWIKGFNVCIFHNRLEIVALMGFHKRHLHITYTSGSGFFGVVQKGKARVKVTDQGRYA